MKKKIKTKTTTATNIKLYSLFLFFLIIFSCKDDEKETDKIKPNIEFENASFPKNCDTVFVDKEFEIKFNIEDNEELGSLSIDIHNNFDHHTHNTEGVGCNNDKKKEAVKPYKNIIEVDIPANSKKFAVSKKINISSQFQTGDYHMFITVVDKQGWSSNKGISFKLIKN